VPVVLDIIFTCIASDAMSRRLCIYSIIYGVRTDDLEGTSIVRINIAESTQLAECSTITADLQEHGKTIF